MRLAGCLLLIPFFAGGAFAQTVTRSFGSVVFPGGTSAISPNISRTFGSVVFPGGSPSSLPVRSAPVVIPQVFNGRSSFGLNGGNSFGRGSSNGGNSFRPGAPPNRGGGHRGSTGAIYAYPVYVPGYYDSQPSQEMYAPQVQPPEQPNVTVVYPPETARPIIIQMGADEYGQAARRPAPRAYVAPEPAAPEEPETPHYLIAFKDHSIYSAVAYWFDGDTLHYFTKGDIHNQAPVGLIDRTLTERLNRELGIDFRMPAEK
jgi:hypothetical protein